MRVWGEVKSVIGRVFFIFGIEVVFVIFKYFNFLIFTVFFGRYVCVRVYVYIRVCIIGGILVREYCFFF